MRATECGEEAWSETASRWTRTGYEAVPSRASGQHTAKLLWSRLRRRKSGGCAGKDCVLTWGDLASRLKGRRLMNRSEESAKAVVAANKGRRAAREGEPTTVSLGRAVHQKPGLPGRTASGRGEAEPATGRDEARLARP